MESKRNSKKEKRVNVYLDEDSVEIQEEISSQGSFSDWVRSRLREYSDDEKALENEENECLKRLEEIRAKRSRIQAMQRKYFESFDKKAREFFLQVPVMLDDGQDIEKIVSRFNFHFKKTLTVDKFKKAYDYFRGEMK